MIRIYVDADGCPVKQEICKVAKRYGVAVTFVANTWMQIGHDDDHKMMVVDGDFNAADNWIVEQVAKNDIVVTADIPLAARCLAKEAIVLDPRGGAFTENGIGQMLASRDLMSHLRDQGAVTGGPRPLEPRDRSRFLQRLDETIHLARKRKS